MNPVDLSVPKDELPSGSEGLYIVALPGKVLAELAKVASAQGVTTGALLASAIDRLIADHKNRGK